MPARTNLAKDLDTLARSIGDAFLEAHGFCRCAAQQRLISLRLRVILHYWRFEVECRCEECIGVFKEGVYDAIERCFESLTENVHDVDSCSHLPPYPEGNSVN